jgi:hypothetical protein
VAVALLLTTRCTTSAEKAHAKADLKAYTAQLRLGMAPAEVLSAHERGRYEGFRLDTRNTSEWMAIAPYTWGAKNWIVALEFDQGRLSCIRFMTEDSSYEHPADAPPDECPNRRNP